MRSAISLKLHASTEHLGNAVYGLNTDGSIPSKLPYGIDGLHVVWLVA